MDYGTALRLYKKYLFSHGIVKKVEKGEGEEGRDGKTMRAREGMRRE